MSAECSVGNIPSGYKQTDVGVIPEDWEAKRIGAVCKLINGRGFKPFEWKEAGLPIIRIQNLNGSDEFNCYSGIYDKKLEVEPGQLLFAWSGSRGTSFGPHIWTGPLGLLNYHTWKVQIQELEISKDFLLHGLRQLTTYIEGWAHGASALVHVQKWQMENFQIPLPPTKAEQEAIAEALSDTDAFIESLEQLIAKKRQIKQGAMQELLTGKRRLPGFGESKGYKRTDLGVIPEDWDVVYLSDVGRSLTGLTYSPSNVRAFGTLVLRSSNIQNGKLAFEDNVYVDMALPERVIVEKDDILICVRNGSRQLIGKCALIDECAAGDVFGAFMSIYRSKYSKYVFYQFQSEIIQRQINEIMGATINQITNKDMASFTVPFPQSDEEKTAIATILSDMDSEITALEEKLAKARQIKQGMMQKLLTGRIRLL
jgi:type I restriction enzyme, S subunit